MCGRIVAYLEFYQIWTFNPVFSWVPVDCFLVFVRSGEICLFYWAFFCY